MGNSTSVVPAFSNCSVAATVLPCSRGCLRSRNIRCALDGLSITVSPGLLRRPPPPGRIFMPPFSMVMRGRHGSSLTSLMVGTAIRVIKHPIDLARHDKIVLVQSLDFLGAQRDGRVAP